ncbi:MAG: UDP-N-acetylmuramate dehydrogenase [Bacteroidota bacterium]
MVVQINKSLKELNTFGIDQKAARLIWAHTAGEVSDYVKHHGAPALLLGGGSNMLLRGDVEGDVLKVDIRGLEIISEDDRQVLLKVGAGENWHQTVLWTLEQGWGGMENLSLIPGNCGTAPVQNIGAYGVELKDIFHSCEGIMVEGGQPFELDLEGCQFDYRNSIFKNEWRGKAIITHVVLRLTKKDHKLNTKYGAISERLASMGIDELTPKAISDAVISIREEKLPNPVVLGNSGSFFKNPVVDNALAAELVERYPNMPVYEVEGGKKLAAGWLIEQAGWKGFRDGDAGVHKNQALVLVNYGSATGEQVWNLAQSIIRSINEKFGVELQPEVNLI